MSSFTETKVEPPTDNLQHYVLSCQSNHASRIIKAVNGIDLDLVNKPTTKTRQRSVRNCKFVTVIDAASPIHLPPHARMNICRAFQVPNKTSTLEMAISQASASLLYSQSCSTTPLIVRINTIPKTLDPLITLDINPTTNTTYALTRSASKCSLVISFVQIKKDEEYRWGICTGLEALEITSKLNHNAAAEVKIGLINTSTGVDLDPATLPTAPVSRAYFKMQELLDVHGLNNNEDAADSISSSSSSSSSPTVQIVAQQLIHYNQRNVTSFFNCFTSTVELYDLKTNTIKLNTNDFLARYKTVLNHSLTLKAIVTARVLVTSKEGDATWSYIIDFEQYSGLVAPVGTELNGSTGLSSPSENNIVVMYKVISKNTKHPDKNTDNDDVSIHRVWVTVDNKNIGLSEHQELSERVLASLVLQQCLERICQEEGKPQNTLLNVEYISVLDCKKSGLQKSAIDFGASPGGWTQVLRQSKTVTHVLSIDPGCVADRVMQLGGVTHARCNFMSEEAISNISTLGMACPFSFLVCDANIDPPKLLEAIANTMNQAVIQMNAMKAMKELKENSDSTSYRLADLFQSNCKLVLTFKFPYKSKNNVAKHMNKINEMLPDWLRTFSDLNEDDDDVKYEVVYLHANSEAERTIIAHIGGSSARRNNNQ